MKSTFILVVTIGVAQAVSAQAGIWDCKGKPVSGSVYIYSLSSKEEGDTLKTNDISVQGGQLCNADGKFTLYNKQPVTSGQIGFFCDSEKTTNDDLWVVDLQGDRKLPPAFIGFAFKRCRQGNEAKLQASWIPFKGAAPHPAHEIAHEQDGDLTEAYLSQHSTLTIAAPAEEKIKRYVAAYEQRAKQKANEGNGWIAGFWNKCFQEQIAAVQGGRALGQSWFPKKGATFTADDGLFKVSNVISQSPLRILVEGPAQADSAVGNRCYAVLKLKSKDQLKVTQAPMPGYKVKVLDQITGFTVKAIGAANVQIKTLRAVTPEKKTIPEFELTSKISTAQRP